MSPDPIQIEQIRMSMDRGYDIDLSIFSVHSVAAAFKAYFRQLPTPIIPTTVYKYIPKVNGELNHNIYKKLSLNPCKN